MQSYARQAKLDLNAALGRIRLLDPSFFRRGKNACWVHMMHVLYSPNVSIDTRQVMMLDDIYNKRILELAANIPAIGRLARPDGTASAHSKLCGSTVTVDVTMDGDVVTDFAHDVKACALGQASSSIMARNIVGSSADELRRLREEVRAMLKEGEAPPGGKWQDIEVLTPIRDYKARHASTLLTFDAVVAAIDQAQARQAASVAAE